MLSRHSRRSPAWAPAAWLILVAAVTGWMLVVGWRLMLADWLATEPRFRIREWQERARPIDDQDWARLQSQLARALDYTPANAVLHDYLAAFYAYQGQRQWEDLAVRRLNFTQALQHLQDSLALRPDNARAWASIAAARYALQASDRDVFEAAQKALALAPHDPAIHRLVVSLIVARKDGAPASLREWAERMQGRRL
jgi:tetratricopeptide (TPR) repeat protein